MKRSVFATLVFQIIFLSRAFSFESQSLEALNFVQRLFLSEVEKVEVIESPGLSYFAFTSPDENSILVRPHMRNTERKIHLVHEYTHRLRFKKNTQDAKWFSEGLSQLSEYLYSGWPVLYSEVLKQSAALKGSNSQEHYLAGARAYADSFYLMHYIYAHFGGTDLLRKMMKSPLTGWENITQSISELQSENVIHFKGIKIDRDYILRHFSVALVLNDTMVADYSLFFIHPLFVPLSQIPFESGIFDDDKRHDFQIVFSKSSQVAGERTTDLVYSVMSSKPFQILKGKHITAEIYIFIRQ